LREIFDLFDKQKTGIISSTDLETIMGSLQRDPDEVRDYIDSLGAQISFDMFLDLMQQVENQIVNSNQEAHTGIQQPNSDQLQAPTS
jgi:Ca2+-binding EF-hand superfamily protein